MSMKNYKKLKYLGKGSYGAAILVQKKSNNQKYVVKEIVIGHLKPDEQAAAKKEADVLHSMNHSNITMYIESFAEGSKLYIVMELADGGDLSAAVAARKSTGSFYSEEEVMRIFVQICLALKHVHDRNILHRDLKSQNIFLTSTGVVKLGDFGIAKVLEASCEQAQTQIGTPYYLSPEICESKPCMYMYMLDNYRVECHFRLFHCLLFCAVLQMARRRIYGHWGYCCTSYWHCNCRFRQILCRHLWCASAHRSRTTPL